MIILTSLNGTPFDLNPDLIETVTANPDTRIVLVNGRDHIVRESPARVRAAILLWRRRCACPLPPRRHP